MTRQRFAAVGIIHLGGPAEVTRYLHFTVVPNPGHRLQLGTELYEVVEVRHVVADDRDEVARIVVMLERVKV